MILDNFEQVVEHGRETVSYGSARNVGALPGDQSRAAGPAWRGATSGRAAGFDTSLALFLERARRLRPGLTLEGPALAAAQEVVRLVEGMPLAIELAAARMRVMSAEKLLAGMRQRFRLLTGSEPAARDPCGGNRRLMGTLAPMGDGGAAQSSVFDGGFTLEAAEEVIDLSAWPEAPWVVDVVQSLVDKSLLRMRILREELKDLAARDAVRDVREHSGVRTKETRRGRSVSSGKGGAAGARAAEERHGAWFARYGTEDAIEGLEREGGWRGGGRLTGSLRT